MTRQPRHLPQQYRVPYHYPRPNASPNGSAALRWKPRCHWPRQRLSDMSQRVTQGPGRRPNTKTTALFLVAPHRDECLERVVTLLTVEQLLYWSDWMYRAAAQIEAKTKFRFGNIVPKQWTLSGFVQHTSANSMYKDDNKISRQQKVLHMNKMLERVPHFQTSFSVGIQPLS